MTDAATPRPGTPPADAPGPPTCVHCGLPLGWSACHARDDRGRVRAFCCPGCRTVWGFIHDAGLEAYYARRGDSVPGLPAPAEDAAGFSGFDSPGVHRAYVRRLDDDGTCEAELIVKGIHCASCIWLIEEGLCRAGADTAEVHYGTHRARVQWNEGRLRLSDVLRTLARLGYEALPYDPQTLQAMNRRHWRKALARLGLAGFGAGNVMLLSAGLYAGYFYGIAPHLRDLLQWASAVVTLPVVAYSGWPFLRGAWSALRLKRFSMDTLIALGITVTFAYSCAALFTGGETYFDSVAMLVFFLLVGRTLETLVQQRSGSTTERLMGLQGRWATRLLGDGEETVAAREVAPGDRLRVRSGEALPVDGTVAEGESELDESALTGEAARRAVAPGDAVLGGTVNVAAPLVIRAAQGGDDTALARICRMVERAQSTKTPLQRLADRVAGRFVWGILLLAGATFVLWQWGLPHLAPQPAWVSAIAVLIIACPCALGLATPVAVLAGVARAGRTGVLVKGGAVLEGAARLTDVVLDKTGTLTEGRPRVHAAHSLAGVPEADWLPAAAALERGTVHPLARAVQHHVAEALPGHRPPAASAVRVLPGRGVSGRVGGRRVLVGNARLLSDHGLPAPEAPAGTVVAPEASGAAGPVYVALDDTVAGLLWLADPVRPDAPELIRALQRHGVRVHLLSGDRAAAVARLGRALGTDEAAGGLLPDDKLARVLALQARGGVVAMVGDGINDAPALTQAELGIAVGAGSDLALEAAGVILTRPRLDGVVETLRVARVTARTIRENLALSLGYNALAVPLAMSGQVIPLAAALAMASSSLLVVLNAGRLHRRVPPGDPGGAAQRPAPVLSPARVL